MDNGSTDGSREIAKQLADQVVDLPGVPISTLRNAGAALLADVDVLAYVDADCELAADWLQAGLAGLETADMVGSRTRAASDASWVAARWAAIEQQRRHEESLLWSQHLLVSRETFQLGVGAAATATLLARKHAVPLLIWSALTAPAVPVVGWRVGRSVLHSLQDGALMSIWSVVRAGRLGHELVVRTGQKS